MAEAVRFWRAGLTLHRAQGAHLTFFSPASYVVSMSVELSLKSFLLKRGVSVKVLMRKPYGHNLEQLLRAAIEHGLIVDSGEATIVLLMNGPHTTHYFRYGIEDKGNPILGVRQLPNLNVAIEQAARLIDRIAVNPFVLRGQGNDFIYWSETPPVIGAVTLSHLNQFVRELEDRQSKLQKIEDQVKARHAMK